MTTDRTTKALLLIIAVGLWIHLATEVVRPVQLKAQTSLSDGLNLDRITKLLDLIAQGTCQNRKICGPL